MLDKNDLVEIVENGVTRIIPADELTEDEELHLFDVVIGEPKEVQVTRLHEGTTKKLVFDGLQQCFSGSNYGDRDYKFLGLHQIRPVTDKATLHFSLSADRLPSIHTRRSVVAGCLAWADDGWGEWDPHHTQTDGIEGKIKVHHVGGILHSDLNTPTVIFPGGSKLYFQFNELHRTDGPAVEIGETGNRGLSLSFVPNEYEEPNLYNVHSNRYYRRNKLHRSDGPAIVGPDGTYEYRVLGDLHRADDNEPTAVVDDVGAVHLYAKYGKLHRTGGAAFTCPELGLRKYFFCGMLHNSEGPAINAISGMDEVFSLFGATLTKREWKAAIKDPRIEMLENNTLASFETLGARYREEVENG